MSEQTEGTVLVARAVATNASAAIRKALENHADAIEFDFEGIRVLAPSFLDQLLIVTERIVDSLGVRPDVTIVFRNCPPGMQEKLGAIGRAHDADVAAQDDGTWIMSRFA
jgi:hypothetical protein